MLNYLIIETNMDILHINTFIYIGIGLLGLFGISAVWFLWSEEGYWIWLLAMILSGLAFAYDIVYIIIYI